MAFALMAFAPMTFALFRPEPAAGERLPLLRFLSGLTVTCANATETAEFPRDLRRAPACVHRARHLAARAISLGQRISPIVSAFLPIVSLMRCPWDERALGDYLGAKPSGVAALRCLRPDRGWRPAAHLR